jgi:hypothetical protein
MGGVETFRVAARTRRDRLHALALTVSEDAHRVNGEMANDCRRLSLPSSLKLHPLHFGAPRPLHRAVVELRGLHRRVTR